MSETKTEKTGKGITRTERAELRRIVKQRFALLDGQVRQRENEIAVAIGEQVRKEHAEQLKEAQTIAAKFVERHDKLLDEFQAELDRLDKKGVVPRDGLLAMRSLRAHLGTRTPAFSVKDLNREVQRRMAALKAGAGYQRLNLRQMELETQEELALGALETDDARKFLERIPTVEKLLPLSPELRALLPGPDDDGDE